VKRAAIFIAALAACAQAPEKIQANGRALIILGVDGMDPTLTRRFIADGLMPNAARLAREGSFLPLATTNPPQSPVAWSTFITGLPPSAHGIYDFIHRDPETMAPFLSTAKTEPGRKLHLGGYTLPLGADKITLLRHGEAFWDVLARAGVRSTLIDVPTCYPAQAAPGVSLIGGMGVPDLAGSYGTFQLLTTDAVWRASTPAGGRVHSLSASEPDTFSGAITGPPDPFRAQAAPLEVPVAVTRAGDALLVDVDDTRLLLREGEWSGWVPLHFSAGAWVGDVRGMARFFVVSVAPEVTLYVSPVNVDPLFPALPIASPANFSAALGALVGRYHTVGIAEDAKALSAGVLSDAAFIAQAHRVFDERDAALTAELARFSGGLLFVYFSLLDQLSHAYFPEDARALYPAAAGFDHQVIAAAYHRIDGAIGQALAAAEASHAALLVMSDHGFASFERKFALDDWLEAQGYLVRAPSGDIDWPHTRAYGLGFNQLFLNRRGRERNGVVGDAEAPALVAALARALEAYRDPETGSAVVSRVVPLGAGDRAAPDMLVNFVKGYRMASESALGERAHQVVGANDERWRGDHLTDPRDVPGVLLSRAPFSELALAEKEMSLEDMAPTILHYFAVVPPAAMRGRALQMSTSNR
jgi:predicted AlkP superfamily phosphohydrolase/phosphomutase